MICGLAPFEQMETVVDVVQLSGGTNDAVTERDEFIVMEHAPVPAQDPDHPMNADVVEDAYTETIVPWLNSAEHVAPQSMPAGLEVSNPVPAPDVPTVSVYCNSVKLAVTLLAAVIGTTQGAVPVQPLPDHPSNVEPVLGEAVNVTFSPALKPALQVAPQLMPAGLEVTVPAPLPALVIVSVCWMVNVAVTALAAVIETVHGEVPVHPLPDHPVKPEPPLGAAVKVTFWP